MMHARTRDFISNISRSILLIHHQRRRPHDLYTRFGLRAAPSLVEDSAVRTAQSDPTHTFHTQTARTRVLTVELRRQPRRTCLRAPRATRQHAHHTVRNGWGQGAGSGRVRGWQAGLAEGQAQARRTDRRAPCFRRRCAVREFDLATTCDT